MASPLHAGISSSTQANPPEIPPYIQIPTMGNLKLQAFTVLHPYFSFLYHPRNCFVLSVLYPLPRLVFQTFKASLFSLIQRPVLLAARGEL